MQDGDIGRRKGRTGCFCPAQRRATAAVVVAVTSLLSAITMMKSGENAKIK